MFLSLFFCRRTHQSVATPTLCTVQSEFWSWFSCCCFISFYALNPGLLLLHCLCLHVLHLPVLSWCSPGFSLMVHSSGVPLQQSRSSWENNTNITCADPKQHNCLNSFHLCNSENNEDKKLLPSKMFACQIQKQDRTWFILNYENRKRDLTLSSSQSQSLCLFLASIGFSAKPSKPRRIWMFKHWDLVAFPQIFFRSIPARRRGITFIVRGKVWFGLGYLKLVECVHSLPGLLSIDALSTYLNGPTLTLMWI